MSDLICEDCSDLILRFMEKITVNADGCWLWLGATSDGYGSFMVHGESQSAHRVSWRLFHGPIPDELTIDHLCRIRRCVNPGHLEPVTIGENVRRRWPWTARKTHCKHGHEFTPENTKRTRQGHRVCVTCQRRKEREYYRRHNGWRGQAAGTKTHCLRGHEFTEANTYVHVSPTGAKQRVCRSCSRLRARAGYHNRKALA